MTSVIGSVTAPSPAHDAVHYRELELLLLCARTALTESEVTQIRALVEQGIDWTTVVEQAALHGVNPLLHVSLRHTCPNLVPREFMEQIQGRFAINALRNLRRSGELVRLLSACTAQGILAVPIKGPVLAAQVYGDVALREFVDLDLLVHPSDLDRAGSVLRDQGYTQGASSRAAEEITFTREDGRDMVEIHAHLVAHWQLRRSFALEFDALRPRLASVTLAGNRSVPTLSPEDLLLVLCVHGCSHHWSRLSWIADVAEMLRAPSRIDWKVLLTRARELGCERMVLLGLRLASDLLDAELPIEVRERIHMCPTLSRLAEQVIGWLFSEYHHAIGLSEEAAFFVASRERWRDRLPYLDLFARAWLKAALKPTQKDRDWVSLPDSLAIGYFFIRPLRIAYGYIAELAKRVESG